MHATHSRTGVNTLVPHACLGYRAVWVDGALRLALDVGVALQTGETGAGSCSLSLPALCIDPTGGRATGVDNIRSWGCSYKKEPVKLADIRLGSFPSLQVIIHTDRMERLHQMIDDTSQVFVFESNCKICRRSLTVAASHLKGGIEIDSLLGGLLHWLKGSPM
jgi:hypothetical protein